MFEKTLFGQLFYRLGNFSGPRADYLHESCKISEGVKEKKAEAEQELIWINIASIFFVHIAAVYSTIRYWDEFSYPTIIWAYLIGIFGGLGVTGGAHRLWSHRSYKAKLPLQIFLLICFTISGQNSIYDWVRDHRVHHKYSETDADPHNVKRGFFFSHVGWLMMRKHPDVIQKGKTVDMSDIENDPLLAFHTKYFIPLKIMLSFVIPTAIPPLLWGEKWKISFVLICLIRYVCALNSTWLVNSAAHIWGNRPYDKGIKPAENLWVAICSLGEGWHNYHHVFPWDYKAAELGPYSTNPTTMVIDLAAKLGLAYDLKHPSEELVLETARKRGDGTLSACCGGGW